MQQVNFKKHIAFLVYSLKLILLKMHFSKNCTELTWIQFKALTSRHHPF